MSTVTSIKELMVPGRITGVLVNENNFNVAVASALGCEVSDTPPLVEGHQVLNFNGEVIHVINWVEFTDKQSEDKTFQKSMEKTTARDNEILMINDIVAKSHEQCLLFAGYEIVDSLKFGVLKLKIKAQQKAIFLTGIAVIVDDKLMVSVIRQSNRQTTGDTTHFRIR